MKQNICDRLAALREMMKQNDVAYYYITTADYHASEYADDYFKEREFMSGFTGSNGNLLVGMDMAGLWTDGRYFIQAEKQLEGTYTVAGADMGTLTLTVDGETLIYNVAVYDDCMTVFWQYDFENDIRSEYTKRK